MTNRFLGIGGRLKSGPADSLVNSRFHQGAKSTNRFVAGQWGLVDLAYTITGINTGVIPAREGSELLSKLLELHSQPGKFYPETGSRRSVYQQGGMVAAADGFGWMVRRRQGAAGSDDFRFSRFAKTNNY